MRVSLLTHNIMHDGSRCFLSLPPSAGWISVREHIAGLKGAEVTRFITDGITEAWLDFSYAGHAFSINDSPGDYWLFVSDPACPEAILQQIADHFASLLEPADSNPGATSNTSLEPPRGR